MSAMIFTSPRRDNFGGGWYRTVKIGELEYSCSVRRGKSVRIPYKPRGRNKGWQWWGAVHGVGGNPFRADLGRVPGSIGCRGLLIEAGVLEAAAHD